MRALNIYLEDSDYENLKGMKGKLSWRDFLLLMYSHCLDSKKAGNFEVL